ncbi:G patch domain-containing protein 2-like [Nibea albiflora]|uniref:G patch domain-containing protein 2-like n=1 Tax=Nibea albiflora TaxID=240163 RepID=A0ACB7FHC4_NIBAL|nr:G patch domain-containing protein 2-like [Nibea albiflora]
MLECCALQMPADVSRGGVQMSRGLGSQSGEGAEGLGRGVEGRSRTACLGQTSSRFPREACSLSHLLLADVSGDDAGPSGQEDARAGRRETSSTCSSDPGLFTNDEGRQGDDEQSDWFFEGDCGVGTGVAGLLPGWDSDSQLSLEGNHPSPTFLQPARLSQRGYRYHSRLKRLPGSAACCIRKDRRRLPSSVKGNRMPVFVERLRHFSQDPYQRELLVALERICSSALSSRGGPSPPSRLQRPRSASASV